MTETNGHEEMTADYATDQAIIYLKRVIEAADEEDKDLAPYLEKIFAEAIRITRENHQAIGLSEAESESKLREMEKRQTRILEAARERDRSKNND